VAARTSALYWRSPYSKSLGSAMMRAPCALARSQWAFASSTRTITEWLASPGRGDRRSPRASPMMTAPSPTLSCERWSSPILTRSAKPNAAPSQSTAARTSG
jgi:hypothetical protein